MATWGDQTCQRVEATAVGFETRFSRPSNRYAIAPRSSSSTCSLYKYSDDLALADFSNSDGHFEQQVTEVTRWCKDNYLG